MKPKEVGDGLYICMDSMYAKPKPPTDAEPAKIVISLWCAFCENCDQPSLGLMHHDRAYFSHLQLHILQRSRWSWHWLTAAPGFGEEPSLQTLLWTELEGWDSTISPATLLDMKRKTVGCFVVVVEGTHTRTKQKRKSGFHTYYGPHTYNYDRLYIIL